MAKLVDKEQKRRDIALSCKDLVVKKGINSLTVSALAKEAGVGKGTLYDYFHNKEEIVFEIANALLEKYDEKLVQEIEALACTKDKIKRLSEFFYSAGEYELREIYKEFTAISLMSTNEDVLDFQTQKFQKYFGWFKEIIHSGIQKGELIEESMELSLGLFVVGKGMFLVNNTTKTIDDLKDELDKFIDNIFKIIEVKK